ncbi:MAG: NYN domain-containing protein [Vicinamibacterales bacterium]
MTLTDTRSRIAVFIDFDNVEIGVKSTIGGQFDIGLVLEAIKERGEIVTKIAYSDWKRAGDYSRLLTQHAIRMVQRNLTPGGDKNGADITMALDALEMAFTHDHINAFVIVGGDSDFISLVEKLKQYGRRVIVVGGRQFTSLTMQRNCHEFIAYENLVGAARPPRAERGAKQAAAAVQSDIARVLPLVKRALKVLSEREVTPQLGLLKSTLLQLDSTFSEREYGAGSFRDFMEKVARAGAVTLKHAGRSMLVEPVDEAPSQADVAPAAPEKPLEPPVAPPVAPHRAAEADDDDEMPVSELGNAEGVRAVQQAFSSGVPRWPMYIRQAKQFLKTSIENFDERRYGFASVVDLLRAAAKTGVVRIERDRQGGMRVFPGVNLKGATPVPLTAAATPPDPELVESGAEPAAELVADAVTDIAAEPPIVDAEVAEPSAAAEAGVIAISDPVKPAGRRRRTRSAKAPRAVKAAAARSEKPRARDEPRTARKSARSKPAEAADKSA